MPYLFFVPLAWWAMHDQNLLVALWMFGWGLLPSLLSIAYANPIIKLLMDINRAMARRILGEQAELPLSKESGLALETQLIHMLSPRSPRSKMSDDTLIANIET